MSEIPMYPYEKYPDPDHDPRAMRITELESALVEACNLADLATYREGVPATTRAAWMRRVRELRTLARSK